MTRPSTRVWERIRTARLGTRRNGWTHARSYRGLSPTAFVHRARLARLRSLLRRTELPASGLLIDLGCSDGFILAELRRAGDLPTGWRVAGYDHTPRLIAAAEARRLPQAEFGLIDLNDPSARPVEPADLVLCLETLEHVGDYRSALQVIHGSLRPGGRLILSMPNELGLIGLVKFVGRPMLRTRPYRGLFSGSCGFVKYAIAVAAHGEIARLRNPARQGWAQHLGFDHRAVTEYVRSQFVVPGAWIIERIERPAFGANRFLVVRSVGSPDISGEEEPIVLE